MSHQISRYLWHFVFEDVMGRMGGQICILCLARPHGLHSSNLRGQLAYIGFMNVARHGRKRQRRDARRAPRPHVEKWSQKPLTLADAWTSDERTGVF